MKSAGMVVLFVWNWALVGQVHFLALLLRLGGAVCSGDSSRGVSASNHPQNTVCASHLLFVSQHTHFLPHSSASR